MKLFDINLRETPLSNLSFPEVSSSLNWKI